MALRIEAVTEQENPRLIGLQFSTVKPGVIEKVVSIQGPARDILEAHYHKATDFVSKYRLARDLILDGRIEEPEMLLEKFVHPDIEIPEDQRDLVKPLKERLHFLLIQKGVLAPASMDQDASQRLLREELRRRQDFQDLIEDGWPIEVIGQLMTVDVFTVITDAKKLEEYRSWTTRGIMRDYLGVISGKTPRREMTVEDITARIPKRVFSDPNGIKFHLVEHYIQQRLMRSITDAGLQEGLASIEALVDSAEDPAKKEFLQKLCDRFYDIATEPRNEKFKRTISLKGQERPFPSFEQLACGYDFVHFGTRLITAETGLGKTGAAYWMIEKTDAKRVLVLAPASAKATWEIEEKKLFGKPGDVFIVEGSADLEFAIHSEQKYFVISHELLGLAQNDQRLADQLERLVDEKEMDGGIVDEIDNLSNPKAVSTKTAQKLLAKIRQNYAHKTGKAEEEAPIIGLTATPIRSRLSDLNVAMGLLYPDKYVISHGESTASLKTFSDTNLNRPDLVYYTLIGEKRMFRWEQATGVQEFKFEPVIVEVSPFEKYIYTFIANEVATDQLNKIRILEDCLFNPLLVKAEVRTLARRKIPTFEIDRIMQKLSRVVGEWKRVRNVDEPLSSEDYLSADRLVELGLGDMVLACFFSDLLENGIDTLVEELTQDSQDQNLKDLRRFWKSRDISTKYKVLKELIEESLEWRTSPNGNLTREKVSIVSPSRRQGRTGNVLQREIGSENGDRRNLYAQYELDTINDSKLLTHIKEWIRGYCDESNVLLIDGSVGIGRLRDRIIDRWVNIPDDVIMLMTLEATYQSRDYTLNEIEDSQGRQIKGVREILLAPPWHYRQLKQKGGRHQRQGQLVPLNMKILQSKDLIDQGKAEAVLYTYLLSRMALSGIVLKPDEQTFFDSKRVGNRIPFQSPESRFLRDALNWVRGAGEDRLKDYLQKKSSFREEVTQDRLIAEKFFDNGKDEFHITGYNAELVAYLIKKFLGYDSRILSLGAGTLLLQRKLKRGIDNVDINPHMMEVGWALAAQYCGRKIEAKASSLSAEDFPTASYDLVDSAFALNWSSLEASSNGKVEASERVKILSQIHRVLKQNGVFILTLPEKSFDQERFERFCTVLENHFGFQIDREFSGQSFGRSKFGSSKRLGWCIVARRVGDISLEGVSLENLEFANEKGDWVSYGPGRKKKKGQGIYGGDYPAPGLGIKFDQYEIVNDRREVTIITYQDGPISFIDVDEDISNGTGEEVIENLTEDESDEGEPELDFLRGETKEDYREYRTTLIRPVMRMTQKSWREIDEVEQMCSDIFRKLQKRRGSQINNRLIAYTLIIREVKRRTIKNARRGVEFND